MSAEPLAGRRILITRPREQAEALVGAIEAVGGEALRQPMIEIAPPRDAAALERALRALPACHLAIFASPTAVREGLKAVGAWPAQVRVAAVGPGTRAALEERGVEPVIAPRSGADSDALLAEPELQDLRGRRILLFRGEAGRDSLPRQLATRGAEVIHAECYRRAKVRADLGALVARWQGSGVDAVTAFSAGALENLFELLPADAHRLVCATPLFASHERIAGYARRRGVAEVLVAGPGGNEMLVGLLAYFGGGK